MSDTSAHAGQSALLQAEMYDDFGASVERQIRSLQEALAEHRQRSWAYRTGAHGERAVAASVERVLVDLGSADWHILADRRWPGTRRSNLDLVLVGPPGVLVLDSKKWKDPRIERGSLWNGDALQDDTLDKLGRQADAVAGVLADIGLAPAAVLPYLVLAGRKFAGVEVRGVVVVGERSVQAELVRLGSRLDSADVATLVSTLDRACPPAGEATPTRAFRLPAPRPPARAELDASPTEPAIEELVLLEDRDLWASVLEAAAR
ncbi:MAG TPA: nuclease-related domain-containing protein, partial [Propionibacteriaceae bacterium]|nr:nuclease-related domain-containing protein [Propionibacteriaceae bacterium]